MCSPYRPKSSSNYWVRKRVPEKLRGIIGQREIKRSLGTSDQQEAKKRALYVCADIDQRLTNAERSLYMDVSDAKNLAGEHFQKQFSNIKEEASEQDWDWDTFQIEQERLTDYLQKKLPKDLSRTEYENEAQRRKASEGLKLIQPLLEKHGLTPPDRIKHFLGDMVFRAEQAARRGAAAELYGNSNWQRPDYAQGIAPQDQSTLTQLFSSYVQKGDKERAPRTIDRWRKSVERAHHFFGRKPAAQITREDVKYLVDALLNGDKRATPKGQPLAGKTVRTGYVDALSAVYAFAIDEGILKENPTRKIQIKTKKSTVVGYTREQVWTILRASRETPSKRTHPKTANVRRWVPWLAAFTGARISELLWLERKDVQITQGIAYIDIHPDFENKSSRSVKTSNSTRVVPLHPAIINEGFLDYWNALPAGEKYLFPGDWSDQNGDRTKTPSNKLADWIKRQLPNADWNRLSPHHSFRHWMVSECRRANISPDYSRALAGHLAKDEHGIYGPGDVPLLYELLERIPLPEDWE